MLDNTCPECNRPWQEYSEMIQKTFRLEERLSHAKLYEDDVQVKALTARLTHLADEQTRLGQALTGSSADRAYRPISPWPLNCRAIVESPVVRSITSKSQFWLQAPTGTASLQASATEAWPDRSVMEACCCPFSWVRGLLD